MSALITEIWILSRNLPSFASELLFELCLTVVYRCFGLKCLCYSLKSPSLSVVFSKNMSKPQRNPSGEDQAKKKRNYKLLVDPELRRDATKKIYRFDGCVPGVGKYNKMHC